MLKPVLNYQSYLHFLQRSGSILYLLQSYWKNSALLLFSLFWIDTVDHDNVSRSVISDSLRPHGLWPTRLLCPRSSPGNNTLVGCHSFLQGLFPTQGSNPSLLHCRQILYYQSYQRSKSQETWKSRVEKMEMSLSTSVAGISSSQASRAEWLVSGVLSLLDFELALLPQAAYSPYRLSSGLLHSSIFGMSVLTKTQDQTPSTSPWKIFVLFLPSPEERSFSPPPLLLGSPFLQDLVSSVVSASSTFYHPSCTGSFPQHRLMLLSLLLFKRIPPSLPTSSPSSPLPPLLFTSKHFGRRSWPILSGLLLCFCN